MDCLGDDGNGWRPPARPALGLRARIRWLRAIHGGGVLKALVVVTGRSL